MAESTANAYATNGSNTAAGSPTAVAVVNDGTGNRQIVVLGAGDGTTALVDGTTTNPLNSKLVASTNIIGKAGIDQTTPGVTNGVSQKAATTTSGTLQSAVSATGNGTIFSTDGMSSVIFTVSGTFVATVTFEGTEDGTNYTSLSSVQLGTTSISSTASVIGVYQAECSGLQNVRARVTWTSGTSITVTAHASPVAFAGKTVNANITDSTNISNVLKSDGTAAGQNALMTAGTYLSVPFTTSTVQAVGSTDAGNYRSVSVQINTQGTSSTITFQGSNDNINWLSTVLVNTNSANSTPITSSGSVAIYSGNTQYRYFRLNVTGISALTTAGVIIFSTLGLQTLGAVVANSQQGTWTVGSNSATGSAVPATAFYMGIQAGTGNLIGIQAPTQSVDSATGNAMPSGLPYVYNGTTYDRTRSATSASNTTGTGLLGAAELAVAATALPTAATATNYTTVMSDKFGRQIMIPQAPRDLTGSQNTTITASTAATTVVTAGAAGILTDITSIVYVNSSATGTVLTLSDGTKSRTHYCPPTDMRGVVINVPYAATTAATAWTVACTTAITSLFVTVEYVNNK
jgi:hypothetical protein